MTNIDTILSEIKVKLEDLYNQGYSDGRQQNIDETSAPHDNVMIDIQKWKVTLPVDKNNTFKGEALELKNLTGVPDVYPFIYLNLENNLIMMDVPVEGATTSGSHYPRCEFREMRNGTEAKWRIAEGGKLECTMKVLELPTKAKDKTYGDIVIGQIHGPKDELCRLYYTKGQFHFVDDKAGPKQKETVFTLISKNIPIGEEFTYTIEVKDNSLTVTIKDINGAISTRTEPIGDFWKDKDLYFKAGCYCQVGIATKKAGTVGTGFATVGIKKLKVSH